MDRTQSNSRITSHTWCRWAYNLHPFPCHYGARTEPEPDWLTECLYYDIWQTADEITMHDRWIIQNWTNQNKNTRFSKNRTEPEPLLYKPDQNPNRTEPNRTIITIEPEQNQTQTNKQLGFFPVRHPTIQTAKEPQPFTLSKKSYSITIETRCSAVAERPRCRVRYSFR